MSTLALNKLLEYILSLSLTNSNKDWLAGKIIESKIHESKESERESRLYSLFGAWNDDEEMDAFEKNIKEGRLSGVTRNIVSFDEV